MAGARIASHSKPDENGTPRAAVPRHERFKESEAVRRALAEGVGPPIGGVTVRDRIGLDLNATFFTAIESDEPEMDRRLAIVVARGEKAAGEPRKSAANGAADLLAAIEAIMP